MLNELSKDPSPETSENKESYALACGISLGLLLLGAGTIKEQINKFIDLHMETRLIHYVVGSTPGQERNKPCDSLCRLNNDIFPDINSTCPAALIALSFIYFNSNNRSVLESITLPEKLKGYMFTRSDFYMLYIITSGLIQWDNVVYSSKFISKIIPKIITESYKIISEDLPNDYNYNEKNVIKQVYLYTKAGLCLLFGLKYSGSFNKEVKDYILKELLFIYNQLDSILLIFRSIS